MATPPPPGSLQTSSQSENQKGYNALGNVKSGIEKSQQDVQTTMAALMTAYGGQDGGAFQKLLSDWNGQVDIIKKNIGDMMTRLEQTGLAQKGLQAQTTDIISGSGASNNVFDQLT
ncbi:hypothetical protein [Streptomyces sp. NPDC054863]